MTAYDDIADPALADAGRARVAWAERAMPVLGRIRERFAAERPFDGVRVAACLHVTTETAGFVRALVAGGAQVDLAAANPLSTQDDVAATLTVHDGLGVHARRGVDRDGYYRHIDAALAGGPHLVLDDACDLVTTLHTARPELLPGVRGGCEGTATGVVRLAQMAQEGALRFPMVAVNDTDTKRLVDNRSGTGQSTLDALLRATHLLLAGRVVVVAGYGYCGKGVAERAAGMGAQVVVTEVDPVKALDATLAGFRVLPMAEAARVGDVFVTVTGNRDVIREEHLAVMRDGAVLANSGHFDVEIDVRALRRLAVDVRPEVRPQTDEYVLPDGRRLLLLAEGRAANLGVAEGNPTAVMDMSFAVQALTAAWLVGAAGSLAPGVHPVPPAIDREVAALELAALGVGLDTLTSPQQAYLASWQQGS